MRKQTIKSDKIIFDDIQAVFTFFRVGFGNRGDPFKNVKLHQDSQVFCGIGLVDADMGCYFSDIIISAYRNRRLFSDLSPVFIIKGIPEAPVSVPPSFAE